MREQTSPYTKSTADSFFDVAGRQMMHGAIGATFENVPSSAAEAVSMAGLDWSVELTPAFAALEVAGGVDEAGNITTELEPVAATRHRAIVRRDTPDGTPIVLGIAGRRFEPLQNSEAYAFLDELVSIADGAKVIAGGALDDGRRTFALVELPRHIALGGGDRIDQYLLAENRHDGGGSFTIAALSNRVQCTNAIRVSLSKAQLRFKARHTSGILTRVEEARIALGVVDRYAEALEAAAGTLLELELTHPELVKFSEQLFPMHPLDEKLSERQRATISEQRTAVVAIAEKSETTAHGRGTAWAAWNAATEFDQHFRPSRLSAYDRAARGLTTDTDAFATRAMGLLAPQLVNA